jgi:hypothetical protein
MVIVEEQSFANAARRDVQCIGGLAALYRATRIRSKATCHNERSFDFFAGRHDTHDRLISNQEIVPKSS